MISCAAAYGLQAATTEDEPPAPGPEKAASKAKPETIDVRIAKAKLDQVKAELGIHQIGVHVTSGAVLKTDIDRLVSRVKLAQAEVQQAESRAAVDLLFAKAAAEVADAELKAQEEANRRAPGSVTAIDFDRLKVTALVYHLQLEKLELEPRLAAALAEIAELKAENAALRKNLDDKAEKK